MSHFFTVSCIGCRQSFTTKRRFALHRHELAAQERRVVNLICEAKSNKQIAFDLGITKASVSQYVYRVCRKVGVHGKLELALWALKSGVMQ